MSFQDGSVVISGLGSYAPSRIMTNDDLARIVETSDAWIHSRTGIRERRIAGPEETASSMGCIAAHRALADAGLGADAIDAVIVATITPDMPFPATACLVQEKLGLPRAFCMDIEAACSGFLYAMEVAASMLQAGKRRHILVIGSEKLSSILDWEDRSTCVLFGDGAGAAVLSRTDAPANGGVIDFRLGADGSKADILNMPGGGCLEPATPDSVARRQHFLKMRGREVFKLAVKVMEQAALEILEQNQLNADDIACVIPHQANLRIIEAIATRLGLPLERFFLNMSRYGNTSAASIPIALDEAYREGRLDKGDRVLMLSFGAGLTWGSALVAWNKPRPLAAAKSTQNASQEQPL